MTHTDSAAKIPKFTHRDDNERRAHYEAIVCRLAIRLSTGPADLLSLIELPPSPPPQPEAKPEGLKWGCKIERISGCSTWKVKHGQYGMMMTGPWSLIGYHCFGSHIAALNALNACTQPPPGSLRSPNQRRYAVMAEQENTEQSNVEPAWHEIPKRLHPVRCGGCNESWFCRTIGNGGNNERDFWPRFCCYCGMRFTHTNPEDPDGTPHPPVLMNGTPL